MKTLDLSQFDVTSLSNEEELTIEGGLQPFFWMAIAWAIDSTIEAATGQTASGHIAGALSNPSTYDGWFSTAHLAQ